MLVQRTLPYTSMVIFIEDLPDASCTGGLRWTKLSVDIHFFSAGSEVPHDGVNIFQSSRNFFWLAMWAPHLAIELQFTPITRDLCYLAFFTSRLWSVGVCMCPFVWLPSRGWAGENPALTSPGTEPY